MPEQIYPLVVAVHIPAQPRGSTMPEAGSHAPHDPCNVGVPLVMQRGRLVAAMHAASPASGVASVVQLTQVPAAEQIGVAVIVAGATGAQSALATHCTQRPAFGAMVEQIGVVADFAEQAVAGPMGSGRPLHATQVFVDGLQYGVAGVVPQCASVAHWTHLPPSRIGVAGVAEQSIELTGARHTRVAKSQIGDAGVAAQSVLVMQATQVPLSCDVGSVRQSGRLPVQSGGVAVGEQAWHS